MTLLHKAAFLDRDGVINIDHGYTSVPEQFDFIDGIFDACRHLQQQGYLLDCRNQSKWHSPWLLHRASICSAHQLDETAIRCARRED
ncbi:MAG: hypothetical protein U5L01_16530 [Rheinheimera sp.]|nr:hypothetical protein [Rheinheimera sp.]